METTESINRSHKDRVFRLLFNDKKNLIELYNCLNGTNYTDIEDLTINTLDNAIYMKMKNDVSFIIDSTMCLYEHQSTYCPNMPLRGFFYLADLYKKLTRDAELTTSRLIKIPTPHYIVFYNGAKVMEDEKIQRLSSAFEDDTKDGCLELTVKMININLGHNDKLLENCKALYGYSFLVSRIRYYKKTMSVEEVVNFAIEECIAKDILADFLREQKSEVVAMSIYEYDEEKAKKSYYEDGKLDGIEQGITKGELKKLVEMVCKKLKKGKSVEIISGELEEPIEVINAIYNEAKEYAPDYDIQPVLEKVLNDHQITA